MAQDDTIYLEAINQFTHLYTEAKKSGTDEPSVMFLATTDESGKPSVRTMTFSHFDPMGFVFFTNSHSRKGAHLNVVPFAAMCFFWSRLKEQITIEGPISKVSDDDADQWWLSRTRDQQFAAWASDQSAHLENRETLRKRLDKCREQFIDGRVPKPPHWIGYKLIPERIEFWHAGWRYLHERVCYENSDSGWRKFFLNP